MRSCLVACMDGSFECMTHGSLRHAWIKPSCMKREVKIEKTKSCGMEEGRWMKGYRRKVRGGQPNTPHEWGQTSKRCGNNPIRPSKHALNSLWWCSDEQIICRALVTRHLAKLSPCFQYTSSIYITRRYPSCLIKKIKNLFCKNKTGSWTNYGSSRVPEY